jgi:hypothetical protein
LPLAFAQTAIAVNASRSVGLVARKMKCSSRMFLRVDEEPFSMHVPKLIFRKERGSNKRLKMLYNENILLIAKCRYCDNIETSVAIVYQCGLWFIEEGHKLQVI